VVVDVGDVLLDFKGLEAVVDQLWAEAWHVYTGEQLPFWEVFGTSERSRQYEQDSPMQTAVDSFIAMLEMDKHSVNGVAYFELGAVFAHMEMKRSGPNSATTNELKDLLIEADCIEPEGRANTRHPGTGATGRWWKYEFRKS
jgi:hypothetical protein